MKLLHFLVHLAIYMICLTGVILSFFMPWARTNIRVSNGFFAFKVPIDIGLLKCFSDICRDYDTITHSTNTMNDNTRRLGSYLRGIVSDFQSSAVVEDDPTARSATHSKDNDSGTTLRPTDSIGPVVLANTTILESDSRIEDSDNIKNSNIEVEDDDDDESVLKLPFKLPHIDIPSDITVPPIKDIPVKDVKIPPISLPPTPHTIAASYRSQIERAKVPFEYASVMTIMLLAIAVIGIAFSFYFCVFDLYHGDTSNFTMYTFLFIASMVFVFLAVVTYITVTYKHLNGGWYQDGLWICAYSCLAGLLCSLLTMILIDRDDRSGPALPRTFAGSSDGGVSGINSSGGRHKYTRIQDLPLIAAENSRTIGCRRGNSNSISMNSPGDFILVQPVDRPTDRSVERCVESGDLPDTVGTRDQGQSSSKNSSSSSSSSSSSNNSASSRPGHGLSYVEMTPSPSSYQKQSHQQY